MSESEEEVKPAPKKGKKGKKAGERFPRAIVWVKLTSIEQLTVMRLKRKHQPRRRKRSASLKPI